MGLHVSKGYSRAKKIRSNSHCDEVSANFSCTTLDPNSKELIVKLPISAYTSQPLHSNAILHSRLEQQDCLPEMWNMSLVYSPTSSAPYLSLYKLQVLPPLYCCTSTFMITIAPDASWTLCVGKSMITRAERCDVLRTCPEKLCSMDDVVGLVSCLEGSKLCEGNPDEKFKNVLCHRGGMIMDQTGKLASPNLINSKAH